MPAATIKTGSTALKLKNTSVATKVKGPIMPVTEGRRYNLLVELQADSTTAGHSIKIKAEWLDETQAIDSTQTLFDSEVTTADTWQCLRAVLAPPNGSRYARITIEKAAQAFNVVVDRVRLDECCTNLDDAMSEIRIVDDFVADSVAAPWGDLGWNEFTFTNATITKVAAAAAAFDAYSEVGVVQSQAPTTNGYGGGLVLGSLTRAMFYGRPPLGCEFRAKVRLTVATGCVAWAGIWSSVATYPDVAAANTISGIGFRATTTGGAANWFGVVRTGTTETVVDLGVAAGTTWRTLGWRRELTGIRFQVGDVDVGTLITSTLPATTVSMNPAFGIITTAGGVTHDLQVDAVGMRSFHNRWAA